LLGAAGEHPKVIAERLGHRDVTLTRNVYSHVGPGMQERATDTLGRLLFENRGA
jgi:integrase